MGTRADFYVGRGEKAEWLGSIGWDGYPQGIPDSIKEAETEEEFRQEVKGFIEERDDGTTLEMGWPWPWVNSELTDYAYAFDDGEVYASAFGRNWFNPTKPEGESETWESTVKSVFPNMSDKQNVTFGVRSGLMGSTSVLEQK